MRDMWYICERCCCEEPCVIYIEGGGHSGGRRYFPCLLSEEHRKEMFKPLTNADVEEYEIEIRTMEDRGCQVEL